MTNYFSHDYDAQNDIKLQHLVMKLGYEALGRYWCIVEMLYKQDGRIELSDCESIAFALRTDSANILQIISLVFEKDDKYFWSETILKRLKIQKEISKVRKNAAKKKWKNEAKKSKENDDANAMQMQSKSNAIKEKKSKINKNKGKEEITGEKSIFYLSEIPEDDLEEFTKSFVCTPSQVKSKAAALIDWCKSNGRAKKDYKAFLRNALRKDFGERKPQPAQFIPEQAAPPITEEQRLLNRQRIAEITRRSKMKGF